MMRAHSGIGLESAKVAGMSIKRSLQRLTLGLAMLAGSASAAPPWEYAAIPQARMHLAAASVSSGVAGVTEILAYTCITGIPCTWSLSIAMECTAGDLALALVTTPNLTVAGHKGQPTGFVQCLGPNPGLPGTHVYGIQRPDIFNQLSLLDRTLTLRVALPKADRMREVQIDFGGSAPMVARVNAAHTPR